MSRPRGSGVIVNCLFRSHEFPDLLVHWGHLWRSDRITCHLCVGLGRLSVRYHRKFLGTFFPEIEVFRNPRKFPGSVAFCCVNRLSWKFSWAKFLSSIASLRSVLLRKSRLLMCEMLSWNLEAAASTSETWLRLVSVQQVPLLFSNEFFINWFVYSASFKKLPHGILCFVTLFVANVGVFLIWKNKEFRSQLGNCRCGNI